MGFASQRNLSKMSGKSFNNLILNDFEMDFFKISWPWPITIIIQ